MISLDQVLLLQKKVETAVQRLAELSADKERLTSENDALRSKCAELSKALEDKTELVSNLEADQTKIEAGILSALSRLDTVENSMLGTGGAGKDSAQGTEAPQPPAPPEPQETPAAAAPGQDDGGAERTEEPAMPQPSVDGQFDIF